MRCLSTRARALRQMWLMQTTRNLTHLCNAPVIIIITLNLEQLILLFTIGVFIIVGVFYYYNFYNTIFFLIEFPRFSFGHLNL